MKRPNIFFIVMSLFLLVIIGTGIKELSLIGRSLKDGVWYFFILAGLFQLAAFAFQSEVRRSLYRILEIREKFLQMMKMTFSAMFIGTAIPSFHMAALALFMKEAKLKGYSHSKALVASIAFIFFDLFGFFAALVFALFLLFRLGNLNNYQLVSSGILFLAVLGGGIFILLALRKEEAIKKMFQRISRFLPKKQKNRWFPPTEIEMMARETVEAKKFYLRKPLLLWRPLFFSLLAQTAGALTLMCCFLAFGVPFTFTTIIVVYAMAVLFQIVAITPYGLGSSEFFLTIILSNFGVNLSTSLMLILVFRFFTFWTPMLAGYLLLQRVGANDQDDKKV